jgi:hypothetical protein
MTPEEILEKVGELARKYAETHDQKIIEELCELARELEKMEKEWVKTLSKLLDLYCVAGRCMMAVRLRENCAKIPIATRIQTLSLNAFATVTQRKDMAAKGWTRMVAALLVRVADAFVLLDLLHKFGALGLRYLENFLVGGLIRNFAAVEHWEGLILGRACGHAFFWKMWLQLFPLLIG